MKVTLYMAISVDGLIKGENDTANSNWITDAEWDFFNSAVLNAGSLVVGKTTYLEQSGFPQFKDVKVVVVSKNNLETFNPDHLVAHSPKEALELLKDFNEVLVVGGGLLNASFMDEDLVDEIYLDVEPVILGQGIPLFKGKDFQKDLKLLGIKNISDNELQLHYEVIK